MQLAKVFGLMAALTALFALVSGWWWGTQGAVLFFLIAAVMNVGVYWFSDRAVLRAYRARIVGPDDAPQLYEMIDRLRQRAGLPMPRIAIAPQQQPNAFATGRDAKHAIVCFTEGILRLLPEDELPGALQRLEAGAHRIPMDVNPAAAQLAIVNPLTGMKMSSVFGLFRTHPSTDDRVQRLRAVAAQGSR